MPNRSLTGQMPVAFCLFSLFAVASCSSRSNGVGAPTVSKTTSEILARYRLSAGAATHRRAVDASRDGFAPRRDGNGWKARPLGGELQASWPSRADRVTRLSVSGRPDLWVELRAQGLHDVAGIVDRDALVFRDAAPDLDVVHVAIEGAIEEFRLLRSARASSSSRWTITHGPGIREVRLREGRVEALDETGAVRFASDPVVAEDANGEGVATSTTLEGKGEERTLRVDADVRAAAFPVMVDPKWTALAARPGTQQYFQAVPLGGDKFLLTGGMVSSAATGDSWIYDLTTNKWTAVGPLNVPRIYSSVVPLPGGSALVIGGIDLPGSSNHELSSVEKFNPTTMSFDLVAPMFEKRGYPAVVTLTSGKILAAAGSGNTAGSTAEIYDPSANTWTKTGSLPADMGAAQVFQESATTVLLTANSRATTHRLSLTSNTWTAGPTLVSTVYQHSGMFKSGSKVLLADEGRPLQLLDPATDSWSVIGSDPGPGTVLSDGRLFLSPYYLYDSATETFKNLGPLPSGADFGFTGTSQPCVMPASGGRAISLCGTPTLFSAAINGVVFTTDSECASGFCTDGVCCDKRCNIQCQACAESGSVGTCKTVSGAPRAPRASCDGTGACAATCNGVSVVCGSLPPTTTECAPASCSAGSFTTAAFCDASGTCGTGTTTACGAYACAATGCKTTCAGDGDCATGKTCVGTACVDPPVDSGPPDTGPADTGPADTGPADTGTVDTGPFDTGPFDTGAPDTETVDTSTPDTSPPPVMMTDAGSTPTVKGDFQSCSSAGECASGFCVDGVCCDRACNGTCESCALPTSPGKCSIAPLGVDPRAQCGAGGACLSTCDGTGKCRTAFAGSQCAPNRCTGPSTGTAAAFCVAEGAACPNGAAIAFDCGAYACEPAFGACASTCRSTDDCAPGNVCDVASGKCAPVAPESDSGCAVRGAPTTGEGELAAALLAGMVAYAARRRRRACVRR
jgi:MYXO-CTERM domain-containing protein